MLLEHRVDGILVERHVATLQDEVIGFGQIEVFALHCDQTGTVLEGKDILKGSYRKLGNGYENMDHTHVCKLGKVIQRSI